MRRTCTLTDVPDVRLRLILMRHGEAESVSDFSGTPDHARRLTPFGEQQAAATGQALAAAGWRPSLAITSDAARAKASAQAAAAGLGWIVEPALYLAGLDMIAELLEPFDAAQHQTVIVVGHNPGFSAAASRLAGEPVSLGTAHAALLEIEAASWSEAMAMTEAWTLVQQLEPRL